MQQLPAEIRLGSQWWHVIIRFVYVRPWFAHLARASSFDWIKSLEIRHATPVVKSLFDCMWKSWSCRLLFLCIIFFLVHLMIYFQIVVFSSSVLSSNLRSRLWKRRPIGQRWKFVGLGQSIALFQTASCKLWKFYPRVRFHWFSENTLPCFVCASQVCERSWSLYIHVSSKLVSNVFWKWKYLHVRQEINLWFS